jgi:hypothetical protein
MGKTSLIFRVMDSLKSSMRTAFLFQTQGSDSRAFLRSILKDAGIPCDTEEDVSLMHELLNEVLLEEASLGRRFVLFIDEAQNLDGEVLESVRLLSNFETPTAKLMHIVLAGQPALSEKLASPELVQLKQRVASVIHLSAFSLRETTEYISHRLQIAGYSGTRLFTSEATALINRHSEGIPRNINSICFQALSLGFANGARTIDVETVTEVLADLKIEAAAPPPSQPSPQWSIPALPDLSYFKSSEVRTHSRKASRVAVFSLIALPIFFLALFGGQLLGGAPPNEFAARILGIALGSSSVSSNDFPNLPSRLRAPAPPESAFEKGVVEVPVKQEVVAEDQLKEPDPQPVHDSQHDKNRTQSTANVGHAPRIVWARRSETLFQVAMEYYGKADWPTVHNIRQVNPQIRDPYAVIRQGQRIVLPELSTEQTRGSDSHTNSMTSKRHR